MDTIVVESERRLRVGAADARMALVRSLRHQQFTLTSEQVSIVTAKRGSQVIGSVQPKKLPVMVKALFQPTPDGCTVTVRLADAWRSGLGKVWGMNGPYRSVLGEIQTALDEALAPFAALETQFAQGTVTLATRDIPGLSLGNAAVAKAGGAAAEGVDALLTPTSSQTISKSLDSVVLRSSKGVASFDRMGVEALLTVGLLVASKPGAMPANLAHDVELLSTRLETAIAAQPSGRLTLEIDDGEAPVAQFLAQQAAIRETLPLRTLHVCTTCKFEKVVNPDYEKLQEKNHRKRVLTGAVGATVSTSGVSPFLLVGSLLKLKNFDIPFVCPRCQGLDADSSVVTYCPNCGQRHDDAVLRRCGRCRHNFGAQCSVADGAFWLSAELPPPIVAPAPLPMVSQQGRPAVPFPSPPAAFPAPVTSSFDAVAPTPAGWLDDPTHRHEHRYWDGRRWTAHVADHGTTGNDPVERTPAL